jgi:hypothetical protein
MKKYKLCYKKNDEAIDCINAISCEAAIIFFSTIKNLSEEEFLKIYDVKLS